MRQLLVIFSVIFSTFSFANQDVCDAPEVARAHALCFAKDKVEAGDLLDFNQVVKQYESQGFHLFASPTDILKDVIYLFWDSDPSADSSDRRYAYEVLLIQFDFYKGETNEYKKAYVGVKWFYPSGQKMEITGVYSQDQLKKFVFKN